jgi:hypothetical protein
MATLVEASGYDNATEVIVRAAIRRFRTLRGK